MNEFSDHSPEQIAATMERRKLLMRAGFTAAVFGAVTASGVRTADAAVGVTDVDILNFALNLEYLEAEFYQIAVNGTPLPLNLTTTGTGTYGGVVPGTQRQVQFSSNLIKSYAKEIAQDELNHVIFLRSALGSAAVAEPKIDIAAAFNAAAQAAGIGNSFDPYANDTAFLLGAFVFEDVGVTAYHGAAPLVSNKAYLSAAAGILGVEAYHASEVRTLLLSASANNSTIIPTTNAISALRAKASMTGPGFTTPADDQGIILNGAVNIVPTDTNSIVFSRTPGQVLNVVYLGGNGGGGFFPNGMNGTIR